MYYYTWADHRTINLLLSISDFSRNIKFIFYFNKLKTSLIKCKPLYNLTIYNHKKISDKILDIRTIIIIFNFLFFKHFKVFEGIYIWLIVIYNKE